MSKMTISITAVDQVSIAVEEDDGLGCSSSVRTKADALGDVARWLYDDYPVDVAEKP